MKSRAAVAFAAGQPLQVVDLVVPQRRVRPRELQQTGHGPRGYDRRLASDDLEVVLVDLLCRL